jgi:outer membrane protein insertion porin family
LTPKQLIFALLIPAFALSVTSCSNTKKLPADEALYLGATVKIRDRDNKMGAKKRKNMRNELEKLTRPRPNKKILGVRFKLFMYNLAGNPKKETSFRGWIKNKLGEPPVLLSDVNLNNNTAILSNYLQNIGYFQADARGDTTVKNKKATATYTVRPGPQYFIDTVSFELDSSFLDNTIRQCVPKTILKRGQPYNLEMVKLERQRIDAYLKESGFYFFSPDFILINVDSTIGNNKVNMYVQIKPGTPKQGKEMYTIKNVYLFTNFRLNQAASDTAIKDAELYKGYYVVDRAKKYKPYMFEQSMQFDPGDIYSRTDHNLSLNRLVSLGVFKFVKNRFEIVPNSPFSQLNTFYYLTPLPKKSLRAEINGTSKSNNLVGSNASISWRNRNTFRAGELLSITASGGAEVQYSSNLKGYNVYRVGLEGALVFPRFLVPFVKINTKGGFVPKTNIMAGYDLLNKQQLYSLNSFRASYGYSWKESLYKEHTFNPISINYVQPLKVTDEYKAQILLDPTLNKTIEKQFILGSTYNFTYNEMVDKPKNATGFFFSGTADVSGNLAGLILGDSSRGKSGQILGAAFSQYAKVEADFRIYRRLGSEASWANRLIIGASIPHGNSRSLPYIKQFFSGGTSSLRAFRNRALGPGSYNGSDTSLIPDQTGDIKLELNTELRTNLFSVVDGAAFIDAGNIWLYNSDPNKPGAQFSKNFLKEIAVGTGLGLRIDVSVLVIRLDVAFPIRKPWLPEGERWVIKQIQFGNPTWRKENLIFNIGLGYPF